MMCKTKIEKKKKILRNEFIKVKLRLKGKFYDFICKFNDVKCVKF